MKETEDEARAHPCADLSYFGCKLQNFYVLSMWRPSKMVPRKTVSESPSVMQTSLLVHLNFFSPHASSHLPSFSSLLLLYLWFCYLVTQHIQPFHTEEAKQNQDINIHFKGICFESTGPGGPCSLWCSLLFLWERAQELCDVCDDALGDKASNNVPDSKDFNREVPSLCSIYSLWPFRIQPQTLIQMGTVNHLSGATEDSSP